MPSDMFNGFTMNGLIPVLDNYRFSENEKANGGKGTHWSKEKIVDMGSLDNIRQPMEHIGRISSCQIVQMSFDGLNIRQYFVFRHCFFRTILLGFKAFE
jgi:hypothetical protein